MEKLGKWPQQNLLHYQRHSVILCLTRRQSNVQGGPTINIGLSNFNRVFLQTPGSTQPQHQPIFFKR